MRARMSGEEAAGCETIIRTVRLGPLLWQPHDEVAVGVVLAEIDQLERGAAEIDGTHAIHHLVRHHHVGSIERDDAVLGIAVRHEGRTLILERLPASDVIEVRVTVDDILDRRGRDLADFLDIGLRGGPTQTDRVGHDDAVRRDDEH